MQASTGITRDLRAEPAAPRRSGHPRARLDPLAREIAVVLAVKLAAILLLWFAFFRAGDAPRSAPAAQAIADHIASPASSPEVPVAVH